MYKNIFHSTKEGLKIKYIEYSDNEKLTESPLVSVIMLAYNHAKYINLAIEGVIKQKTTFPIELVIGEDCSTDETLKIALSYQKTYPKIIRVITGVSNVGARENSYRLEISARGKYIAYCEGDDYWHDPNKLQIQTKFLDENAEYGLTYTNADTLEIETGKRLELAMPVRTDLCQEDDPYLQQLLGAIHIWPLTVCVRRELSLQILHKCPEVTDPTYAMGDTQRYLELSRLTKFWYMPISTATRNLLPESATRSKSINKKIRFVESSERLTLHYLNKYPIKQEFDFKVRSWLARRGLYYAFLSKNNEKADSELTILNKIDGGIAWKYHMYYFGSKNALANLIVRNIFKVIKLFSGINHTRKDI